MSTKGILSEQPQGIGSILGGSEFEKPNRTGTTTAAATSLRRTLSADMSSKKWLLQHGFSPLKRIASSEELQSEPSSDDIWNSNQSKEEVEVEEKNKINEQQQSGGGQYDMWSSILTQKPSSLPPPYVHPLVKRSKSSLTGKSLEICTENLGSDSGSDGFSSYSPSEISSNSDDDDDDEEEVEEEEEVEVKESEIVEKQEMAGNVHEKVNYSTSCSASSVSRKSPPRSFPPPLPSLSRPGLHIRPRREDGRLVLQAITVPSQNYFHAQRQDGRLLLTFIKSPSPSPSPSQQQSMENDENEVEEEIVEEVLSDDEEEEEEEEVFESEDEEEAMVERGGFELEMELSQPPTNKLSTGVINVHRSAVMVNKLIGGLAINRNPNWSYKLEKMVQMEVEEETNDSTLYPQSLPPPPRKVMPRLIPTSPTTVTSSFNTYEYCWRRKPSSVTGGGIMTKQSLPIINNNIITNNNNTINNNFLVSSRNSSKAYQEKQQQFVVKRGRGKKGDYLLAPLIKSCKEPRRSLLSWEPYCIATS